MINRAALAAIQLPATNQATLAVIQILAINQVTLAVIQIPAINQRADQIHLKVQIVAINQDAQEDLMEVELGNQRDLAATLTLVKEQIVVISHLLTILTPVISQVEAKFCEYET